MTRNAQETSHDKQPSRAKYKCPLELLWFIENELPRIPAKIDLPSIESIQKENLILFSEGKSEKEKKELLLINNEKIFNECFRNFAQDFKDGLYLKLYRYRLAENPKMNKHDLANLTFLEAIDWYEIFREQRDCLRSISRFFAQIRSGNNFFEGDQEIITNEGEILKLPTLPPTPLSREGTKGKISSGIAKILDGLDLDRIRECEICGRIFWAKRSEAKTCSSKCLNTYKVRRYRSLTEKEKNQRKEQRDINRQYKMNKIKKKQSRANKP